MSATDSNVAVGRLLMIGGAIGALVLFPFSWPASLVCVLVAALGRRIMTNGRPSNRLAHGWTAFRPRR